MKESFCRKDKKMREYQKEWRRTHPNYHREWLRKHPYFESRRLRKIRLEVIQKLGGTCQRCGFTDSRALQIDHLNGGGRKEFERLKSPTTLYRNLNALSLDALKADYQVLCSNCNWIKRYENQETPKKELK